MGRIGHLHEHTYIPAIFYTGDIYNVDRNDHDGLACEGLPSGFRLIDP